MIFIESRNLCMHSKNTAVIMSNSLKAEQRCSRQCLLMLQGMTECTVSSVHVVCSEPRLWWSHAIQHRRNCPKHTCSSHVWTHSPRCAMPLGVMTHGLTSNALNNSKCDGDWKCKISLAVCSTEGVGFCFPICFFFFFLQMGEGEEGKLPYCLHEDLGCILVTHLTLSSYPKYSLHWL